MKKLLILTTMVIVTHMNLKADNFYFVACDPNPGLNSTTNPCGNYSSEALNYCQELKVNGQYVSENIHRGVCLPASYHSSIYQIPAEAIAAGIPANIFNSCVVASNDNPCNAQTVNTPSGPMHNLFCRAYDQSATTKSQSIGSPGICLLPQI